MQNSLVGIPRQPSDQVFRLNSVIFNLLQSALCQPDEELQSAMKQVQIQRYIGVQFADYTAIGIMHNAALKAGYHLTARIPPLWRRVLGNN